MRPAMRPAASPVSASAERISVADRFAQSGLWRGLKIIEQITQGSLGQTFGLNR